MGGDDAGEGWGPDADAAGPDADAAGPDDDVDDEDGGRGTAGSDACNTGSTDDPAGGGGIDSEGTETAGGKLAADIPGGGWATKLSCTLLEAWVGMAVVK